ncbi:MAG: hypothetical protein QW514_01010 [Thermoprotei archaeon]
MSLGILWTADLFIAAVSAILTAWLFALYLRRAADLKSKFSYGLALLSGVFFAQSATSLGVYFTFSAKYSADVALPLLAMSILGLAGFAVLTWVARQ